MTNKRRALRRRRRRRMRKHTINVVDGQIAEMPKSLQLKRGDVPFMGEKMTCIVCGKQQKSNQHVNTQWRCLIVDETRYYACPEEFPPDGSSVDDFTQAYETILKKIIKEVVVGNGTN